MRTHLWNRRDSAVPKVRWYNEMRRISCGHVSADRTRETSAMANTASIALGIDCRSSSRRILAGIGRYMRLHGQWNLCGEPSRSVPSLPDWRRSRPDGVIAGLTEEYLDNALITLARRNHIPIVDVYNVLYNNKFTRVASDDLAIGHMVGKYFLARGFKNLAFCGHSGYLASDLRLQGLRETAQKASVPVSVFTPTKGRRFTDGSAEDGRELVKWIHSWINPVVPRTNKDKGEAGTGHLRLPIAVFGWHDYRAANVADICRQEGLKIPDQVSIVGCHDDNILCELQSPPISSAAVPLEQIGYRAAEVLDRLMAGDKPPEGPILIPPVGIVTRGSSDAMALDNPDVVQAIRIIREHADKPLSVENILAAVPTSRRSLEREFRRLLGRSPRAEIERVHLGNALYLLAETNWPIPRVAEKSGYGSLEHFSATFRKKMGFPPTHYRRKFRGQ